MKLIIGAILSGIIGFTCIGIAVFAPSKKTKCDCRNDSLLKVVQDQWRILQYHNVDVESSTLDTNKYKPLKDE